MANKQYSPSNVKVQATQIQQAWTNIGAEATYGDLSLVEFNAAMSAVEQVETTITNLEDQLTNARNLRKAKRYDLWTSVKRARNGAKSKHGDDSDEYERFGGTRLSERKSRTVSTPPEASA